MDWQVAFNIAFGISGAVGALLYKAKDGELNVLRTDLTNLHQTVNNMREAIPQRYATIDDLKEQTARTDAALKESAERSERMTERIFNKLDDIERKIDSKQDK